MFGVDSSGESVYCGDCQVYFTEDQEEAQIDFCRDLCPEGVTAILGLSLTACDGKSYSDISGSGHNGESDDFDKRTSPMPTSAPAPYPSASGPNDVPDEEHVHVEHLGSSSFSACDADHDCTLPDQCVYMEQAGEPVCTLYSPPPGAILNPSLSIKVWFLEHQHVVHFELNNETYRPLIDVEGTCIDILPQLRNTSDARDYLEYEPTGAEDASYFFSADETTGGNGRFEICLDQHLYCPL